MTDQITVSRELLRQALEAIELNWKTDEGDAVMPLLRTALEQPAVEPVAEVVWSKDTDYEFKFKMLVELCCKEGVPVKLYAGPFDSGGMYWHDTDTDRASPQAPQAQQQAEETSEMIKALNAWACDLQRGMQVSIPATSLRRIATALSAAQAQQPQLLTDEEIKDAIRHLYQDETALQMSIDITLHEFRAIEQAVRQKAGLK